MAEEMTNEEAIAANAEVALKIAQQRDPAITYGDSGAAWLDGYIERLRLESFTEQGIERLVTVLGSFLGECIRQNYGGTWAYHNGVLAVVFSRNDNVYPFVKTRKQWTSGRAGGESVLSLYRTLPLVMPSLRKQ
jgi:hypothetical protein